MCFPGIAEIGDIHPTIGTGRKSPARDIQAHDVWSTGRPTMDVLVQPKSREDAYATPIEQIDVSNPHLYQDDTWRPYFERLRREDPVHWCENGMYGAFWSVTRYRDIMAVDTNHKAFSSDALMGGIVLRDVPMDFRRPSFISMDPPRHDEQRKIVAPIVAPMNLANLSGTIRERVGRILDDLPRGETFDWVDRVSVELTTQMLATLFDFPFEERRKLTYWSNVATVNTRAGTEIDSEAKRHEVLDQALNYCTELWHQRAKQPPRPDLISMLAHGEATRDLPSRPHEFLGNLMLLVVGGNDTTRNSISGGLLALNKYPEQYRKLREKPELVTGMVPEIIRWQTPVIHMRRTALEDTEVAGKTIRKGAKVAMWYLSGNRDEDAIEQADDFIIDRARPRQHLSFGFGIHRCVGNRLAEMQLTILWEEILKRDLPMIEVVGEPVRGYSNILRSINSLPVRIPLA